MLRHPACRKTGAVAIETNPRARSAPAGASALAPEWKMAGVKQYDLEAPGAELISELLAYRARSNWRYTWVMA